MGSNQREYFKVSNHGAGLQVRVYALSKGNDTSFIMYNRIFNPSVTNEIRLFGLNDDDVFEVEDNARSRIKIRIIGGKGNDTFDIKGHVDNLLYDLKTDGNFIKSSNRSKNRFALDPPVNDRSVLGFNYNTTRFPKFHINYNSDDKLVLGVGFAKRTHGFRNLPYATDQKLNFLYAVDRRSYQVDYRGEFNHLVRNYDLLLHLNFANPALRNFTGFGNNPPIDKSKSFDYYLTKYRSFETSILFRKRFFEKAHVMAGPYYYEYYAKYKDNTGHILGDFRRAQLDSADIFSKKTYAGVRFVALIDNRNREFFPTRGIQWNNELIGVTGLRKGSDDYIRFTSDMAIHASFSEAARVVAILKVGGGHIFSSKYEYFQMMTLGANNSLNGFRKNRFSGTSVFYSSLELKMKLFDINSFILPGTFGISGFYDGGRVWLRNSRSSTRWHNAYGGGVFYMPFNLFAINFSAGFSEGERMLNFTFGTRFNITY